MTLRPKHNCVSLKSTDRKYIFFLVITICRLILRPSSKLIKAKGLLSVSFIALEHVAWTLIFIGSRALSRWAYFLLRFNRHFNWRYCFIYPWIWCFIKAFAKQPLVSQNVDRRSNRYYLKLHWNLLVVVLTRGADNIIPEDPQRSPESSDRSLWIIYYLCNIVSHVAIETQRQYYINRDNSTYLCQWLWHPQGKCLYSTNRRGSKILYRYKIL